MAHAAWAAGDGQDVAQSEQLTRPVPEGGPAAWSGAGHEMPPVGRPGSQAPRQARPGGTPAGLEIDPFAPGGQATAGPGSDGDPVRALPPGQRTPRVWPVMHYGPVPVFRPARWDLRVCGATASGREERWDWAQVSAMPLVRVTADMHCVARFSLQDVTWQGIPGLEVLHLAPPAPAVTHVMVWADYGYSANVPICDFADDRTLLATHLEDAELAPEHGYPIRLVVPHRYAWKSVKWVRAIEYLTADRRGFWEERGYHNNADPWREQRFSYQEMPGEGPPL